MVATFRMLSDEVRRNIPDILLATMNILFTKHKVKNGILFPKLLWPTVRKKYSSGWEKLLKFEAEDWEFAKFLRSLEQFIQTVKGQNNFW